MNAVKYIQMARKAGLNMREVSDRLDAVAGKPNGIQEWQEWVASEVKKTKVNKFQTVE